MPWKPAARVFKGGTEEVNALRNKKARLMRDISEDVNRSAGDNKAVFIDFKAGIIGLIAGAPTNRKDLISIVFLNDLSIPKSLDAIQRKPFHAIWITWDQFKNNFEIDI